MSAHVLPPLAVNSKSEQKVKSLPPLGFESAIFGMLAHLSNHSAKSYPLPRRAILAVSGRKCRFSSSLPTRVSSGLRACQIAEVTYRTAEWQSRNSAAPIVEWGRWTLRQSVHRWKYFFFTIYTFFIWMFCFKSSVRVTAGLKVVITRTFLHLNVLFKFNAPFAFKNTPLSTSSPMAGSVHNMTV
jgi:hypothetical protein